MMGGFGVGTNSGLNLLDPAEGHFSHYRFDPDDPHSLSSNWVSDIYQDRSGVVWIATLAGISKVNEIASRFTHYQQRASQLAGEAEAQPGNPPSLSDNMVSAVYQDSQGIVWVGTAAGGLNRLDRDAGSVTVYRHDATEPSSLRSDGVQDIYEDRAGTLWIGTNGGLDRFNPQTETFEAVEALRGKAVISIAEDQQGRLWFGTVGRIMSREPGFSYFGQVPWVTRAVGNHQVQAIYPDRTGSVWIATQDDGLFRVDPTRGAGVSGSTDRTEFAITHFPQDASDTKSPGIGPVTSFYEDQQGTLWMGSVEGGLIRFDRDSQTFRHYIPDTGPGKYVSCIQGDAQGFLWMGTKLGLARFDPLAETFLYFNARDGLVAGEGISCFQNKQGEMLFGSTLGLNTFFPDQIRDNPTPPVVVITALNLRNQVLRTDLPPDEQIKLSYRENYLSFDFAALDYTSPAKNQYAYRMEGLESDWVNAGTRRHADYPDLKPGTYTFRVKASNNSGVWNEQGAAVRITITPPFWQTWWFLGLVGVALLGVVAGGIRLRLKGVEARSHDLEKQVRDRTSALEQKTLELQQLYERSQELAVLEERSRLARELHDAVTQTLFSASLVAEALPATWERDPQEGRGLLQELRGLSRGALAEMRTLLLELRPAALVETRLDDLLRQLGEAASGREGIPVTVQVEGMADLPPDVHIALYRITQEALNNVVKHARASQVIVRLGYLCHERAAESEATGHAEPVPTGLCVLLSIGDDGRGFDPAQIPHNRLGLGIMHERAQAIGAFLDVESQPGHGTQITVLWEQEQKQGAT